MLSNSDAQSLIEEIDARQDEVLAQIDALNTRIEQLLEEVRPTPPASEPADAGAASSEPAAASAGATLAVSPDDQVDPTSRSPQAA